MKSYSALGFPTALGRRVAVLFGTGLRRKAEKNKLYTWRSAHSHGHLQLIDEHIYLTLSNLVMFNGYVSFSHRLHIILKAKVVFPYWYPKWVSNYLTSTIMGVVPNVSSR